MTTCIESIKALNYTIIRKPIELSYWLDPVHVDEQLFECMNYSNKYERMNANLICKLYASL